MSKTYISKEKFAIIWGKITSLFVAKEIGKGLSTNDYDNAAVAEVAKIAGKADAATSLSGYGITDAYTKDEIDTTVNGLKADMASVYKVKEPLLLLVSQQKVWLQVMFTTFQILSQLLKDSLIM